MVPRQGGDGGVFIRASWWEMDTPSGATEDLQAHFGPSQQGGSFFGSFNQVY